MLLHCCHKKCGKGRFLKSLTVSIWRLQYLIFLSVVCPAEQFTFVFLLCYSCTFLKKKLMVYVFIMLESCLQWKEKKGYFRIIFGESSGALHSSKNMNLLLYVMIFFFFFFVMFKRLSGQQAVLMFRIQKLDGRLVDNLSAPGAIWSMLYMSRWCPPPRSTQ